jgi:hypothetical protein
VPQEAVCGVCEVFVMKADTIEITGFSDMITCKFVSE